MKKVLTGIKDLVMRHKLLSIICFLAFMVIIFLMYIFFDLFFIGNNKYGDRLRGINDVKISADTQKDIASELKDVGEVVDASVRIQGKIVYVNITYTRETSLDRAKEIAMSTLDKFDNEEKDFYDIGYFLTQEESKDTEEKGFAVTGSKKAKKDNISWIKS